MSSVQRVRRCNAEEINGLGAGEARRACEHVSRSLLNRSAINIAKMAEPRIRIPDSVGNH